MLTPECLQIHCFARMSQYITFYLSVSFVDRSACLSLMIFQYQSILQINWYVDVVLRWISIQLLSFFTSFLELFGSVCDHPFGIGFTWILPFRNPFFYHLICLHWYNKHNAPSNDSINLIEPTHKTYPLRLKKKLEYRIKVNIFCSYLILPGASVGW